MNLPEDLQNKSSLVTSYLRDYINKCRGIPEPLLSSIRYSLLSNGKHIRPLLLMSTFEMYSRDIEKSLPFCAAIEMIHTYSLIHDDMPCMDDSDYRRGVLSNHKEFGEGIAMLAGDSLLNMAAETALSSTDFKDKIVLEATRCLFKKSGALGMAGGQCLDLNQVNSRISLDDLILIAELKTSCLISAAVLCGAILGKANEKDQSYLFLYARNLGIAFQILDDVLEAENNEPQQKGITTFVDLLGIDKARNLAKEYTNLALESLNKVKKDTSKLEELTDLLLNRNN